MTRELNYLSRLTDKLRYATTLKKCADAIFLGNREQKHTAVGNI